MKRYAFLYNPAANGGGTSSDNLEQLQAAVSVFEVASVFVSGQLGDIGQFVEDHFDDYDVFVACGGDGTVREVAARLLNTQKQMGIIPMGTGNDLCKTLNIPVLINDSISLLKADNTSSIDVGKCNDFLFLNTMGIGFDGLANRYASRLKHWPPILTYAIAAFKAMIKHTSFEVSITQKGRSTTAEVIMLTFANGRVEGGSFWVDPKASVRDGKLSMVSIKPIFKWLIPILLPLFLVKKSHWIPHVSTENVDKVRVTLPDHVDIHADGEVIESTTTEYDIRLIANGLNVISGLN